MMIVTINLDKPRHFKFDAEAIRRFHKLGYKIETGSVITNIKRYKAFLWAGLVWEDRNLTLKQVGNFITAENINYISTQINKAIGV
jgi:hypothetical protein